MLCIVISTVPISVEQYPDCEGVRSLSFTCDIKLEIMDSRPLHAKTGEAFLYGMLLSSTRYGLEEVTLVTGVCEVAERFAAGIRWVCGRQASVTTREVKRRGCSYWIVSLLEQDDRRCLLERFPAEVGFLKTLTQAGDIHAFLAGAFVVCGNVIDPEKGYRLEFALQNEAFGIKLASLIDACAPAALMTTRRGKPVVYCKGVAKIEDILTMMGATRASLSTIGVEMIKGIRNKANRSTNCETANIDRQVEAAVGQISDIHLIFEMVGEEALSEALKETARVRLEHPDASLRELIELSPTPVSRSGMHHRFAALRRMADQIREEEAKNKSEEAGDD